MVFHRSFIDNKSLQVTMTHLSILADLNNAVVWMVSTRPLISKSSSNFINPSVTALRALITYGITVTFMFHSFFKVEELSFFQLYSEQSKKIPLIQCLQNKKITDFGIK